VKLLTPRMCVVEIAECSRNQQQALAAMDHFTARQNPRLVEMQRERYEDLEKRIKRWRRELDLLGEIPISREAT
jgi:hypothetical protein